MMPFAKSAAFSKSIASGCLKATKNIAPLQTNSSMTFVEKAEVRRFSSEEEIIAQLEKGNLDMGIILSEDFDSLVQSGESGDLKIYISGSSSLQRRVQSFILLQKGVNEISDREEIVNIRTETMGEGNIVPWYYRLLPLVVLIAVMMGGIFIPATSLIDYKQHKTLEALLSAPVTPYEVIIAKLLLGGLISFLMGLMILFLNRSLSLNTLPLMLVLAVVALSASSLGCIIGVISKDMKSVTTLTQSLMLLMYAPAILNFFPSIPDWIQKLFPTYYFFSPLLKLSDGSFSDADVWELVALFGVLLILVAALLTVIRKKWHLKRTGAINVATKC